MSPGSCSSCLPCRWERRSVRPPCLAPHHTSYPLRCEDSLFSSSGGSDGVQHFKQRPRSCCNGAMWVTGLCGDNSPQGGPGRGCSVSFLTQFSCTFFFLWPCLFLPQIGRSPRLFLLSLNQGSVGWRMKKSIWVQSDQGGLAVVRRG